MKLSEYVESMAYDIAFWLQGAKDPAYPFEQLGNLSLELSSKLRVAAIATLLTASEPDTFFHNLLRSGSLREIYLRRCITEARLDDYHRASGRYDPLFDTLAGGDVEMARRIAALSPTAWRKDSEYEEDYCYAQVIHHLIQPYPAENEITQLLNRFEVLLENEKSARLDVCRALCSRTQRAFEEAFGELLEDRRRQIDTPDMIRRSSDEPPVIVERHVFVEGLAVLRIAQLRNLNTKSEYPFCPSLARVEMRMPFPGE